LSELARGKQMSNFINLNEIVRRFQTDPATESDPVKRMFICDGESITANIATSSGSESKLHTQPNHDEIVIVIDGEAEFRVGDEVRRVGPGDFVFIPRNTIHGRVRTITESMSALSIYAPYFDRAKDNIIWDEG
jgi:quercetin dioxygenase-like cupin family protein